MPVDNLKKEIEDLIALGYEGGYWDYKEDYSVIEEDKLIDIICMANNLCDRDVYIIYGVSDIPDNWLNDLVKKDYLIKYSYEFYDIITNKECVFDGRN